MSTQLDELTSSRVYHVGEHSRYLDGRWTHFPLTHLTETSSPAYLPYSENFCSTASLSLFETLLRACTSIDAPVFFTTFLQMAATNPLIRTVGLTIPRAPNTSL